jgi:hypothetical protein
MRVRSPLIVLALLLLASSTSAQEKSVSKDVEFYNQIKAFSLTGGAVEVKGVVLKRVRTQITLDGQFFWPNQSMA